MPDIADTTCDIDLSGPELSCGEIIFTHPSQEVIRHVTVLDDGSHLLIVRNVGLVHLAESGARTLIGGGATVWFEAPVTGSDGRLLSMKHGYDFGSDRDWSLLSAVCMETGETLWSHEFQDSHAGQVAVAADGRTVARFESSIVFFGETGTVSSKYDLPGLQVTSPTADDGGRTYAATWNGGGNATASQYNLWAFGADGEPIWKAPLSMEVQRRPLVAAARLVLVPDEDSVSAFDEDGERIWTGESVEGSLVTAVITAQLESVLLLTGAAELIRVRLADGGVEWRTGTLPGLYDYYSPSCINVGDGSTFVTTCSDVYCNRSVLSVVGNAAGSVAQGDTLGFGLTCPSVLENGVLVAGSESGELILIK